MGKDLKIRACMLNLGNFLFVLGFLLCVMFCVKFKFKKINLLENNENLSCYYK